MVQNSKIRLKRNSQWPHRKGVGVRIELQVLILEPRLTNVKGIFPPWKTLFRTASGQGNGFPPILKPALDGVKYLC